MREGIEAIIFDWVGTIYTFGAQGLFPYSERVLKELQSRGYRLGLVSKAELQNFEIRQAQINPVRRYFEEVVVEADKSRDQFVSCMKKMHVKPIKTLVVGDRTIREIAIGNSLGCQTAWIKNGKYASEVPNEKTGQPRHTINSICDLLEILK